MLTDAVNTWLKQILKQPNLQFRQLSGGANNLGIQVSAGQSSWFLKCFELSQAIAQKKQQNEFLFSQALSEAGIFTIPKPIAINTSLGVSLFEYIDGEKVTNANSEAVLKAALFIQEINACQLATPLTVASESPNSLDGFCDIVSERLTRFEAVQPDNESIAEQFSAMLKKIAQRHNKIRSSLPAHWHKTIERNIVSPSDFGFHNVLKQNKALYFIDFEYAGLDTPWKLFADFFSQPAVPVDIKHASQFLSIKLFKDLKDNPCDTLKVYELTLLKWCLIMLNEFLPEVQKRRLFSWNISCIEEQKEKLKQVQFAQLHKCDAYFDKISIKVIGLNKVLRETA
ncbi:aminoglycoside phosphotransferase family protein [Pseudoalteromonas luteoviolacea]|uniref:Aminoglycoside phosphotransferase domain-containing protein n=1 Tax=Pseudoalteromonas luteoviolacea H33 TaxID=1365251 RepID=A0A162ABQ5_9GAMM|nr:aminoglycoside phosphotransferase family protein [Pseudoalteromonas luteoviolacea]KZN47183.1 hypothetical protein N476_23680 [Pseudoalteromonas luteoviolacea H33]KZN77201.1 hypothetical protein N477_12510 [Pseudoalteromonas luteoviolacea H33-S]MBQ4879354.1 aminoglycoside phosphotransferase family protein [Pseudoalteromonas luteoviolacea]MBQ4908414.1 aminoglycoside phosphotransferase family protein [Pseudoalteromonas luteoviolacea]